MKDEDGVEDAETQRHGTGVMAAHTQWRPHIAVATPGRPLDRAPARAQDRLR